jgi:hypothetical protein
MLDVWFLFDSVIPVSPESRRWSLSDVNQKMNAAQLKVSIGHQVPYESAVVLEKARILE